MNDWVLILGAKSDIAKAIAHAYAGHGYHVYLAARGHGELESDATDLNVRYRTEAKALEFDVTAFATHADFFASLDPAPVGVISVVGYMPEQEKAQADFSEIARTVEVNYSGCMSILEIAADAYEKRGSGFIVGVSSVAGDRGRKKNYIYGSAKAGFSAYLSGLRNRLYESGVQVLTVKPGFVATKMTSHMELPEKLTAQPQEVGEDIFHAQQKGKDVLYTKWFWRFIMGIIVHIPEKIFKRMNI